MPFADPKKLAEYLSACNEDAHPVHLVRVADWQVPQRAPDTGVVVLDVGFDQLSEQSVENGISLLVNRLGIFDRFDFGSVAVLPRLTDEQSAQLEASGFTVLCDMTGRVESALAPSGDISHCDRGAFAGDKAQVWRYIGNVGNVDPFKARMFYASQLAGAQLRLVMSLVGQVKVEDIAHAERKAFCSRIVSVFDALMVGNARFPIEPAALEAFHGYMSFVAAHPELSPKIMTTEGSVLPAPKKLQHEIDELDAMTAKVRDASRIWEHACRESGSGVSNLASFSHMMMSDERLPLDYDMRKSLAELLGVDSAIDAYLSGVPLDDIFA